MFNVVQVQIATFVSTGQIDMLVDQLFIQRAVTFVHVLVSYGDYAKTRQPPVLTLWQIQTSNDGQLIRLVQFVQMHEAIQEAEASDEKVARSTRFGRFVLEPQEIAYLGCAQFQQVRVDLSQFLFNAQAVDAVHCDLMLFVRLELDVEQIDETFQCANRQAPTIFRLAHFHFGKYVVIAKQNAFKQELLVLVRVHYLLLVESRVDFDQINIARIGAKYDVLIEQCQCANKVFVILLGQIPFDLVSVALGCHGLSN
jgi:hypothetical protein